MFNQTRLYFTRMMKSMGDKSRLIEHIPETTNHIVDVGGADGSFAKILSNVFDSVTVLDASKVSCAKARDQGVEAIQAFADEIDQYFAPESIGVVVASSVIHEIFSYGNPKGGYSPGKIENVTAFLRSANKVLTKGGLLLIRDGIAPTEKNCSLTMDKDYDKVSKFIAESPFITTDYDRHIVLELDEDGRTLHGDMASLWEFVMTYTWGEGSWEREVQEYYGVFTKDELISLAHKEGFIVRHFEAYVQDGYPEHLPHIKFFNSDGEDFGFPFTNAIWVLEKI